MTEQEVTEQQSLDDLWSQILADSNAAHAFRKENGTEAWSRLKALIGRDAALELADKPRDAIMEHLRVEYGFTLQAIADVFDLSRERVRQLTPAGLWHKRAEAVDWEKIVHKVSVEAVHNKDAWTPKGRISRSWVVERFGKDVADQVSDLQSRMNKLQLILRFRLRVPEDGLLQWLNDEYFTKRQSYEQIAHNLSRYVPISTMCVYRNAQALGFRGYAVGKRFDYD